MEVDLANAIAVVTELDGGLADTIAARFAASGATVDRITGGSDALKVAIERRGRIDILVNVAGGPAELIESLSRTAAVAMTRPGGRIVNVASALGLVPVRGESAIAAAAAAVFAMTRALALELGSAGIRVNAVAVGAIGEASTERLLSHTPLARQGTAGEVADAALFLADPENSYTTGQVLTVDGGWTAGYARNF
jgi:NAD(P)-dependent dehydrogenase (short-subunit alcohol dehydrogenase family)